MLLAFNIIKIITKQLKLLTIISNTNKKLNCFN